MVSANPVHSPSNAMFNQHPGNASAYPWFLVLGITVVVAAVQLYYGFNPQIGFDEAWHIYEAGEQGLWKTFLAMSGDQHPPLHFLMLRAFLRLGTAPIFARLPTIIATILTVPLWYALLRKLRIGVPSALTATAVLAASFAFLQLGVVVRAYSIATLLLLSAIWFWLDLLPGTNGQPSRRSAVTSLALFSLAFWTLYAAVFVTIAIFTATLLLTALNRDARHTIIGNWRTHSGWPEWLLFVLAHLLCLGWFALSWGGHVNFSAPVHALPYVLTTGQAPLEFIGIALRQELSLFSPLFGLGDPILNLGLLAVLFTSLWLTISNLRSDRLGRCVLALTPLLLTAILALCALSGRYPLGGWMRHQYILFPYLLMLLPLLMDDLWRQLNSRWLKGTIILLIAAVTVINLERTLETHHIGEPAVAFDWNSEFEPLFAHAQDAPTFIPAVSFFPLFYDRMKTGIHYLASYDADHNGYHLAHQGWLAIGMPWPAYQEYSVATDDGGHAVVIKDHYRWLFDPVPDELFFSQTRQILRRLGHSELRVFALQTNPETPQDESALRAVAARHGFSITEFTPLKYGVIWRARISDTAPVTAPATN